MTSRTPRDENPRRLAQLLVDIRENWPAGRLSQTEMAKLLQQVVRRDATTDEPTATFTQSTVNSIENRQIGYRFVHLEAYARLCKVRTGLLLLVSLYSSTTEPKKDLFHLKEMLKRLSELCEQASGQNRSLTVYDIFELGASNLGDPESSFSELDPNELPNEGSNLERLELVRKISRDRGIDPLKGAPLFDVSR